MSLSYADFFVACGYRRTKVLREVEKVLTMTQEECLQTRERESTDRIPLVNTFNSHTTFIAEFARRNWNFLQSKERLAHIFNKPPLVTYRRPMSLGDRLMSTKFQRLGSMRKTKVRLVQRNQQNHHIYQHCVNCQSSWVIYIIECNICNLQYIGKSKTALNLRLSSHRNHTKKGISSSGYTKCF